MRLLILTLLFSLFFCFVTKAQDLTADSTAFKKAKDYAVSLYHENIQKESGLYNGNQYIVYAQTIEDGIPFFETAELTNGKVTYWGIEYKKVPLMYDILKGEVVTLVPSTNYLIQLHTEKVSSFEILDHKFVRIEKDSAAKNIKTGFYEVLYDGKIALYKKETKTLNEDLSSGKLRNFILEDSSYFIRKGGLFFEVNKKNSLLAVFKDKKKEVQDFMRKNKLKVRRGKDYVLPKIVAFYDSITTTKKS